MSERIHLAALPYPPPSLHRLTPDTPTSDRPDYWAHHAAVQRAMVEAGIAAGQLDATNAILLQIGWRQRRDWTEAEVTMAQRSSIILPRFDWDRR